MQNCQIVYIQICLKLENIIIIISAIEHNIHIMIITSFSAIVNRKSLKCVQKAQVDITVATFSPRQSKCR